jgi:F0F1-type ATP synthase assembly protein I
MVENDKKPYWQPAMEIFSEVSTWIVVPIVLALIFGKMLDKHYGTAPMMFLILIGISFLLSCYGIVRALRTYTKKLKDLDTNN